MFSFPRTVLAPIPEAPKCLGTPDWESTRAPSEPSNTERAERAAKRAAIKRELPARRSADERPTDRPDGGMRRRVTLRASADPHAKSMCAVCRIREGTMVLEQQAAAGAKATVLAEVPVEALTMCLHRGRTDMFTLATVCKDEMLDEIYCFCGDSATRFEWIKDFLRMEIPIRDFRD